MQQEMYRQIVQWSKQPQVQEATIAYLAEHMGKFLKPRERVMLAFLEHKEGNLSYLLEQAALRIDAIPVIWGPDHRWNTLLRQTFHSRASAVIGPPLVILGLMKLKKHHNTPLPIRKVITTSYPCLPWMIDGIVKGLDCEMGGCLTLGETGVVAGFACGHSWGVHLRQDVLGIDIVDEKGNVLPAGQLGRMVLYPKDQPELRIAMADVGRLEPERCACGSESLRVLDMDKWGEDPDLYQLGEQLQSWTSILDCRLRKSESGLEIEIVCFPGEKLPKLPTAAKLIIRPWNPKNDEPFFYMPILEKSKMMGDNC